MLKWTFVHLSKLHMLMAPLPVNKQSANGQIRKAECRVTSKELLCGQPCLGSPLSRRRSLRRKLTAGHGVSLVPPQHSLLLPSDASPHQLQPGHTRGDSCPIVSEVRGSSVQTLNRQVVLGFLPNLCSPEGTSLPGKKFNLLPDMLC